MKQFTHHIRQTSIYYPRQSMLIPSCHTARQYYTQRKKRSVTNPANPAIQKAESWAANPSKGTAVAFKVMKGVPFPATVGIFGDRGFVCCINPTEVCSGRDGVSAVEAACTNEIEAPSGELGTLDWTIGLGLEVSVPPRTTGDKMGLLPDSITGPAPGRVV